MSTEPELLSDLRRHDLLTQLVRRRIIAEAVSSEQLTAGEIEQARANFLLKHSLNDAESIQNFQDIRGWSEEDFRFQISLPILIQSYCRNHYSHKSEAYFLAKKDHLDRVVYSLLRTKDPYLAQELFLRIDSGESNFGDLASEFSEGDERKTKGIIGPVPMTKAHPIVAETLRTAKPGVLLHPFRVAEWWLVIRLESYAPAIFDEAMAESLSKQLFDEWINHELSSRMMSHEYKVSYRPPNDAADF